MAIRLFDEEDVCVLVVWCGGKPGKPARMPGIRMPDGMPGNTSNIYDDNR